MSSDPPWTRRVLGGLLGVPPGQLRDAVAPPPIAEYGLLRRVVAGVLGVSLPQQLSGKESVGISNPQRLTGLDALESGHRAEAEMLLVRAVAEETRRSGGRIDGEALLDRARAALDDIADSATEEYQAYKQALSNSPGGRGAFFTGEAVTPAAVAVMTVAGVAVVVSALEGLSVGGAWWTGLAAAVSGTFAVLLQRWTAHARSKYRSSDDGQGGGLDRLRLQWLTALEVRGIRPYLDRQRVVTASTLRRVTRQSAGVVAGGQAAAFRIAEGSRARRPTALAQSWRQLPHNRGPFVGRESELTQITQSVHHSRASAETKPTVVVLHGQPGVGRATLAVRAAQSLRDTFRGVSVVDLRGHSLGGEPLSTRDALVQLLNGPSVPRELMLFRERSDRSVHLRRLTELYQEQLTGFPVVVVLEDATDAEQVRPLIPERSEALIIVTAQEPLELSADLDAWVYQLPVGPLERSEAEELLRMVAGGMDGGPLDGRALDQVVRLCGALPLALRIAGSALAPRTMGERAAGLEAYSPVAPVERALWLSYTDQPEVGRRLLRRLSLAGQAAWGPTAGAALLETTDEEAGRVLAGLARSGLIEQVQGSRFQLHDSVRRFAHARLLDEESEQERLAAQGRLLRSYSELIDSVLRLVDGKLSTRSNRLDLHGFVSLDAALRWLDDEMSFIISTLRHTSDADQAVVLHLVGALVDYCLLRGDLFSLGELNEVAERGMLAPSVQRGRGVAARQLGELDQSRSTLSSVVSLYREAQNEAGEARALRDLGITLRQQGNLLEAGARLREALELQQTDELRGDRAWTLHALAAVECDRADLPEALRLLTKSLELHRESQSTQGEAWAHFHLGQARLWTGDVRAAEEELNSAQTGYLRTRDTRGEAWALTQLARTRLADGDPAVAVAELRAALTRHRQNEDARGEAWTLYYLGQAQEEQHDYDASVRSLEHARTMFSRMRDAYGLAWARHHSGRVTRDMRAEQTGSLRNSGFARQLLVDARHDFHRIGVPHGEGWSCLELAIIDAGNRRTSQALTLVDEALPLFDSYGDRRGGAWARFLRCTLLPFAVPGYSEEVTSSARQELSALLADLQMADSGGDPALLEYAEAYALILNRGIEPDAEWSAWRLHMIPTRRAREVIGNAVPRNQAAAGTEAD